MIYFYFIFSTGVYTIPAGRAHGSKLGFKPKETTNYTQLIRAAQPRRRRHSNTFLLLYYILGGKLGIWIVEKWGKGGKGVGAIGTKLPRICS